MECIKCGKSTSDKQVFCDDCLQVMDRYPVKPGTPITLPKASTQATAKKSPHKKRTATPDEQIIYLRKHLRRARAFSLLLALLLLGASAMLLYEALSPSGPIIGKNYTIDTTQGTD